MFKTLFFRLVLVPVLFLMSACESEIEIGWNQTFGGGDNEQLYTGSFVSDEAYLLGGTGVPTGQDDPALWLMSVDGDGAVVWQKYFDEEFSGAATDIVQLEDGNFVVSGHIFIDAIGTNSQMRVLKVDPLGNVVWDIELGGRQIDGATALAATADGGVILTGYYTNVGTFVSERWVVKVDAGGDVLWEKNFGDGAGEDIVAMEDGDSIVVGRTTQKDDGRYSDWWVVRLDSKGEIVWQRLYGGLYEDQATRVVQGRKGSVVIMGTLGPQFDRIDSDDTWVLSLDGDGDQIWETTISGEGSKVVRDISPKDDGFVLVGGVKGLLEDNDIYVATMDRFGRVISEKTYDGSEEEAGYSVITTDSDTLLIAGTSTLKGGTGQTDGLLMQLSDSF
jgi:hypothetical protein